MLTHTQIWRAIDALAARNGMSPSGLAKLAGLDPTTFNKSKRGAANGKLRWPSTESLAKILGATGATLDDFVALVAGESAKFHSAFLKIGLSGTELGVSWRLQRAIGTSRAREILLTGRPVDAQEALRIGLVSQVVPDAGLDELGQSLAKAMLEAKPDALRLTKRALDAALEIGNFGTALETEERGQMLMINRRRS